MLTDPAMRGQITDAGRRVAAEHFCDTIIVPRYEQLYEETLARLPTSN